MPRALWKGAIAFGLVHIPVALYPASREAGLDFDWLDKRSMKPVGYKRINKATGKEVSRDDIVRGIQYEQGQYVVLTDDEIRSAYPESSRTIEIDSFVPAQQLSFVYFDRPYYLEPIGKAAKVYALLREALFAAQRVGVARVVIQTKQHLAVLIPTGPALMLNTLRWVDEIRPWDELQLPEEGRRAAGLAERELKMAEQLISDMSTDWDPTQYSDTFKERVMALVERKVAAGRTHAVEPIAAPAESAAAARTDNVIDLTELLKRSLRGASRGAAQDDGEADDETPAPKETAAARKRAAASARKSASTASLRPTPGSEAGGGTAARKSGSGRRKSA